MKVLILCLILIASIASHITLGQSKYRDSVVVREITDADALNPILSTSAVTFSIIRNIFQSLCATDPNTLNVVPVLAKSTPNISEDGLSFEYEIRKEATWDNGSPITGYDYAFTLKVIKNPKVNAAHLRPNYAFVEDVIIDPNNPKKFTVKTNEKYILAEFMLNVLSIIPEYNYDPFGLLKDVSIPQLNKEITSTINEKITKFAETFNSDTFRKLPNNISGSGPYVVRLWTYGERIVLERKLNWWGDAFENENVYFQAYPQKIIHRVIKNVTTAIQLFKLNQIDVLYDLPVKEYLGLKSSMDPNTVELATPNKFSYNYIGFNLKPNEDRKPFFTDKRVRKAIAHLFDVDKMIDKVMQGFATRISNAGLIEKPEEYDKTIPFVEFSPEKAAKLLDEAGWKDTNKDGIRDKNINGERVDFEFDFAISAGNADYRKVGYMFSDVARTVGIVVHVLEQDQTANIKARKEHTFDMFLGGWVEEPAPTNLYQIFHSSNWANGGYNFVGFDNKRADELLEKINKELDRTKRKTLNYEFQRILADELPYILLWEPKACIVIQKRFNNIKTSVTFVSNPGFNPANFQPK
ncbi:MAG: ABC transporter substrate-binding protein [Bacteroidia bacterium]|nr:ABC transporter substrate-binding protein [Bacteroidia bacterium]MDW8346362.1 ABC transporter substrate-binding protein [Bacteroidia bacterium]